MGRAALAITICVVVLTGALLVGRSILDGSNDTNCLALSERVEGFRSFKWDNGFTESGSEWISVLTDGVERADRPGRDDIARAVRADEGGFVRFRRELPDHLTPTADKLHDLILDPDASYRRRADAEVRGDVASLRAFALDECGFL